MFYKKGVYQIHKGIYLVSPNKNHKIPENTLYFIDAFKT